MEHTNDKKVDLGLFPFDPIVLLLDVAKRGMLILLAALMVGVGAYIVADRTYKPEYRATTTYVVTAKGSTTSVYSNLSSANSLANVFSELLNSSIMRKAILQELGTDSFDGRIEAMVIPETNLVTVTVRASDPRTAFLVSRVIVEHHESVTYQVVDSVVLEVLQMPSVPVAPVNRENAVGVMWKAGGIAAVGVALLIAFVSLRRDVVRSGNEARKKLDCDYLGDIPHEKKYRTLISRIRRRKSGILITNPVTSFRYVENIRKLRRRVEQHMHGKKVLMVASLLENEGKSTVAVNLALSLAQKHKRVLLIDCDLRKPACHLLLQQNTMSYGLRDVLSGGIGLSEVLIQDKRSNLFLLLENRGDKHSSDLIGSENMRTLLEWVRKEFDFVVLDLPPMAVVSDAENMMDLADASILVVRENVAATPALNKAIATLSGGKAKLLGCVLNNVHTTSLFSSQGYGYGYGYGYGKYGHYGRYGQYGHYGRQSSQSAEK